MDFNYAPVSLQYLLTLLCHSETFWSKCPRSIPLGALEAYNSRDKCFRVKEGGGILMDDININKPLHYRILYQTCEGLTAGGLISIRFSFPPNLLIDISG